MEPVTKDDGINVNQLPSALQGPYTKLVQWEWNPDYIQFHFYWLSREKNLIVVSHYQRSELRRQTYLRLFPGGQWGYTDIFNPDVQELIGGWLVMGKMNPAPKAWWDPTIRKWR